MKKFNKNQKRVDGSRSKDSSVNREWYKGASFSFQTVEPLSEVEEELDTREQ